MKSGRTALLRDSSKTEKGKTHRGFGQIHSELRMSSKLSWYDGHAVSLW